MLDQSFSAINLLKLVRKHEIIKFKLGSTDSERKRALEKISEQINSNSFNFSKFTESKTKNGSIYKMHQATEGLALKKINYNIRRLYKVKQTDRSMIVNQVKNLLKETTPFHIAKLDLEKFYESVDRNRIMDKLRRDNLLSYKSLTLLNLLFSTAQFSRLSGLPKGVSISASLSEIFMRDFDREVNRIPGIYFYSRYVDDIIIFSISRPLPLIEQIKSFLPKNLNLNNRKTVLLENINLEKSPKNHTKFIQFDYLGYEFKFNETYNKPESEKKVSLSISSQKIKKIQSRIVHSFLDYQRNSNFLLLEDRIKFLTGNIKIKNKTYSTETFGSGIYYNYKSIDNNLEALDKLTTFLRNVVIMKNHRLWQKTPLRLSPSQKRKLYKYSFKAGFERRIIHNFNITRISEIKKCWTYEKN